jgi:hypothetical protein
MSELVSVFDWMPLFWTSSKSCQGSDVIIFSPKISCREFQLLPLDCEGRCMWRTFTWIPFSSWRAGWGLCWSINAGVEQSKISTVFNYSETACEGAALQPFRYFLSVRFCADSICCCFCLHSLVLVGKLMTTLSLLGFCFFSQANYFGNLFWQGLFE